MPHRLITDQTKFEEFCQHVRQCQVVAFDTEFLSEFTYRPELCLLQFATPERAIAVDPFEVRDLTSWWTLMADPAIQVVVHGSREEVRYCLRYAGVRPGRVFDVQIAEGLECRGYPLSYSALVSRVLGIRTHGKETRTDWKRRPLTDRQIAYAIEDVEHLLQIWERQRETLSARGRFEWAEAECRRHVEEIEQEPFRENWRKLPGILSLSSRELAIARELHAWREAEAAARDRPARKILRDDLIIELAHRQPDSTDDLLATRDMNRSDYRRNAGTMLEAVRRAAALPSGQLPPVRRNEKDQDEHILAQLLSIALANRCAQLEVAQGLVGTQNDLKHLVRWTVFGDRQGDPPRLLQGWRAEVCGELLTDVLAGKISLRVAEPQSEHPLVFERRDG
ncbi:MAG: ribonuclease D [Planctomycetales bacterium]